MPDGSIPLLIAIIVLLVLSAFFSSTETSYSCASRIKLRALATAGNNRAKKVLILAEDKYDELISTVLIGNNIVNITAATLGTLFFAKVLQNNPTVDYALISTVVLTLATLIFGEITPKLVAKVYPEKVAMLYYPLVIAFYYLFWIFNRIFGGWKWLIAKIFRLKNEDKITEDEIMTVVEEAEEDGTIREEETQLIRSVIEFDDLEVADILVPRVNIVSVDVESSMEEIKEVFNKEGYSRIPVYKDTIDTVIGTIHEKDFFRAYLNGKKGINDIMQNAFYTTEHVKISKLLKQLQKNKVHIAVVLDEYGGTLGIITLEDILEELVGEIWDEHDEEINYFKEINQTTFVVDGNAPVSDMFEYFNLDDPEDEYEAITVSGFIIEKLGEIPRAGTKFEYKNLDFEVTKSTVKKVLQVRVKVNKPEEDEQE